MIDRTQLFAFRTTQNFINQFDRVCDQLGHKRSEVARYCLNRFINEHHNNPESTNRTRQDLYWCWTSSNGPSAAGERNPTVSDQQAKQIEKSGTKMTKDKLLELIRKSPFKEFTFSQSPNSKTIVVVIA
jgi:hypothetical protein